MSDINADCAGNHSALANPSTIDTPTAIANEVTTAYNPPARMESRHPAMSTRLAPK